MAHPLRLLLIGTGVAMLALCGTPALADEEHESEYKKHERETEVIKPGEATPPRVIERHERVYEPGNAGDAPIIKKREHDVDVHRKSEDDD